jgi:membrane-associated protease RseP (regulator of RpoE activity)
MVRAAAAGAPAATAGLAVGDIVARLDGTAVTGADGFRREIRARRGGDRLELEVFRSGERIDLVAEAGERERPLIRLEPTVVAPRQLELRVDRLDRSGEHVEIRVGELVEQVQRVLGSEAALAGPVRAVLGADRASIELRMREVERELAELERRLRAAERQPR